MRVKRNKSTRDRVPLQLSHDHLLDCAHECLRVEVQALTSRASRQLNVNRTRTRLQRHVELGVLRAKTCQCRLKIRKSFVCRTFSRGAYSLRRLVSPSHTPLAAARDAANATRLTVCESV